MVGLIIATHGRLGAELLHTAEQIIGTLSNACACSIEPGASPESIREQMQHALLEVETGSGVIVLADLFGGTPCNQSLTLCRHQHMEVVTGVNLPMLIKANSLRGRDDLPLDEMAQALATYGQKNIALASALIKEPDARHN